MRSDKQRLAELTEKANLILDIRDREHLAGVPPVNLEGYDWQALRAYYRSLTPVITGDDRPFNPEAHYGTLGDYYDSQE